MGLGCCEAIKKNADTPPQWLRSSERVQRGGSSRIGVREVMMIALQHSSSESVVDEGESGGKAYSLGVCI